MSKFVRCQRLETGTLFLINIDYVARAYETENDVWRIEDMAGHYYECRNCNGEPACIDISLVVL